MEKKNQLRSYYKNNLSSRQAVGRDLPHPMLLLNEEKQPYFMREAEDPAQKPCGMTPNFKGVGPGLRPSGAPLRSGFTLIELLVVVLIIGILAAVALPQYRASVDKARLMKLVAMVSSTIKAQEAYYLANGSYTDQWEELALSFPGTLDNTGRNLTTESWGIFLPQISYVSAQDTKLSDIKILAFYQNTGWGDRAGKTACYAAITNDYAKKLCKKVAPHYIGDNVGQDSIYLFD